MPRLFIAVRIEPPPPLADVLRSLSSMGEVVKTVPARNVHITLRFMGESDESVVAGIVAAMRGAVEGEEAFDLTLEGLGAFPHVDRPSVVWCGTRNDRPLYAIVDRLNPSIDALGFATGQREWNTHLTLARVKGKPPAELAAMLRRMRQRSFGAVRIAAVDLMASELTPTGPIYTVVSTTPLQ